MRRIAEDCFNLLPTGELPPDATIDVWVVPLTACTEEGGDLDGVLSSDERARAAHFRFVRDAARFQCCHAAVRILLGRYLKQSASELLLTTAERGKPRLAAESALRFNLAHSNDLAVIAFTTIGEVGVDVEAVAAGVSAESIAAAYFTSEEAALVRQPRAADARARTFLQLWTRKEAIFKAAGSGLFSPLDSIDVAQSKVASVRAGRESGIDSRWRVEDLQLGPEFIGAVSAPAGDWIIRQWVLSNEAPVANEFPRLMIL
jgi:4'-phosphopantetheinyl transferase